MNLYKEQPRRNGEIVSNRYTVKKFKDKQSRDVFLNKQYDNTWKELDLEKPLKSGVYFQQYDARNGNRWINVKELRL